MPTPHNEAKQGEIAKTVLMPGDPLRAKFIANNWLENFKLVNQVRNMYAYTGTYKGKEITVMASGMGMPSMGIYSYELYKEYDVDKIIRIGSAGSYTQSLKLFDIVLAEKVWSQSTYAKTQSGFEGNFLFPEKRLNDTIKKMSETLEIPIVRACIHSSDVFYQEPEADDYIKIRDTYGCQCVEMESFALFHNANVLGKQAACILTVSDSFVTEEKATAKERQLSFEKMIMLALESAVK
ncbi:MAG: purine-nucleoside phosphorylase [Lachnospiraceae bacterium]|nr:purine-nucleoside phosphorylase [Lachnospiraceae bacterium]